MNKRFNSEIQRMGVDVLIKVLVDKTRALAPQVVR
jgi:hypothetical protein